MNALARRLPEAPALARDATLAALVPKFLVWLRLVRGRAENTVLSYGHDLRTFVAFCDRGGLTAPASVTFRHIELYLAWIQRERGCVISTANRHRHAIGQLFRWCRREGLVPGNPVDDVLGMRTPKRLPKYLTIPEQERVLAALAEDRTPIGRRDYALVATALFCGLRCEELASLRVDHVDLAAGRLRVVGKGDKERELPVIPRLAAILHDYLTEIRPALINAPEGSVFRQGGRAWYLEMNGQRIRLDATTEEEARSYLRMAPEAVRTTPYVFVSVARHSHRFRRGGLPLLTRSIFAIVRGRVSVILGRPIHPHMLRHSFASRLREKDADLQIIQEALGHADIKTTTMYAHISTAKRRADLARLLE